MPKVKKTTNGKTIYSNERVFVPRIDCLEADAYETQKIFARSKSEKKPSEIIWEIFRKEKHRAARPRSFYEGRLFLDNLKKCGVKVLQDGWLEISRWDKAGSDVMLVMQKVPGINTAIRMQDHIMNLYKEGEVNKPSELAQIDSIEEVIIKANRLLTNWKIATYDDRIIIQEKLAWVILALENCRNEEKKEIKKRAKKIIDLKDSRGQINPGALAAHTVVGLNKIISRLSQLEIILPFIAMRKEMLIFEKRRMQKEISQVSKSIKLISRHQVFNGRGIGGFEVDFLDKNIGDALYRLSCLWISPYWEQAEQAKLYLSHSRRLVSKRKFSEGQIFLIEAYKILETNMDKHG